MKKSIIFFLFILLSINTITSAATKILDVELGVPVIISLANKHDGGEWTISSKPDSVLLKNKRKGYLYSYFIFKSTKAIQGPLVFKYQNGKSADQRTYFLRIKASEKKQLSSNKDEKKELVIVSEKNQRKADIKIPGNVKLYINNLIEEELYEKALLELQKIEEKTSSKEQETYMNIDKKYLMRKKIEVWDKKKQYKKIIEYTKSLLSESSEKKANSALEFFLKLEQAKAEYKSGKKKNAQALFIYLKNYYPDNAVAYYELGNFYFQENEIKKGISLFEYLASRFKNPPAKDEVYYKLASYYYQVVGLNGYNLSHKYYKKIVELGVISPYYNESKRMVEFLEENFLNIR